MTQRVGEWKLEFAAAAPLSIHIHIAYGQLRRGSSLLGYVIKQRAAEKPSRILKRRRKDPHRLFRWRAIFKTSQKCNEV
jgi:hypothetical protein